MPNARPLETLGQQSTISTLLSSWSKQSDSYRETFRPGGRVPGLWVKGSLEYHVDRFRLPPSLIHREGGDEFPARPAELAERTVGESIQIRTDHPTSLDLLYVVFPHGASVLAIATWDRESSDLQYRDRLQCDSWEVVVPELVFEPRLELEVVDRLVRPSIDQG